MMPVTATTAPADEKAGSISGTLIILKAPASGVPGACKNIGYIKISAASPQKTNFIGIRQVYRLDLSGNIISNLLRRLPRLTPVTCQMACPFVSITVAETQCRICTDFRFVLICFYSFITNYSTLQKARCQ